MREIRSHTSLRGVAAVLVMLYHYTIGTHYHVFFANAYALVDLFFILSGFIISAVYSSFLVNQDVTRISHREFFVHRFARIYPLYFATLMFMVAVQLYAGIPFSTTQIKSFFATLFVVQAWGLSDQFYFDFPAWSISAEFAAYLCFPVFALLWRKKYNIEVLSVILMLVYVFMYYCFNTLNIDERYIAIRGPAGFLLGMLIFHYRKRLDFKKVSTVQILIIMLITLVSLLHLNDYLLIPLFAMLVYTTCNDRGILSDILSSKFLYLLGVWSYGIYLLHIPVRTVVNYVWPHLGITNELAKIALMVTGTVFASWFTYLFYEKPMRRVLKQL